MTARGQQHATEDGEPDDGVVVAAVDDADDHERVEGEERHGGCALRVAGDEPCGRDHSKGGRELKEEPRRQEAAPDSGHSRRREGGESGSVHRRGLAPAMGDVKRPFVGRPLRRHVLVGAGVVVDHYAPVHGVGPQVARLQRRDGNRESQQAGAGGEHQPAVEPRSSGLEGHEDAECREGHGEGEQGRGDR